MKCSSVRSTAKLTLLYILQYYHNTQCTKHMGVEYCPCKNVIELSRSPSIKIDWINKLHKMYSMSIYHNKKYTLMYTYTLVLIMTVRRSTIRRIPNTYSVFLYYSLRIHLSQIKFHSTIFKHYWKTLIQNRYGKRILKRMFACITQSRYQ